MGSAELSAVAAALSGPPALLVLTGEPGIGKTRLLDEALATLPPVRRVLRGTCAPLQTPYPLGPLIDAVRRERASPAGLQMSGLSGALRPLFPEWSEELPPPPDPLDDPTAGRHRLLHAVAELLGRLTVKALVIDDAQWADPLTVELLLLVARQTPPPFTLAVAYRDTEVTTASAISRLVAFHPSGAAHRHVHLEPLDVAGAAALAASLGSPLTDRLAAELQLVSGGVPLYIEECVRWLQQRNGLRETDGRFERVDDVPPTLTPAIRTSVTDRLARMDAAARAAVHAAALAGEPTDPVVLMEVACLAGSDGSAALAAASRSGLLRYDDHGRASIRPPVLIEAIYADIPEPERVRMHGRLGHALEGLPGAEPAALARHFRAAREVAPWRHHAERAAALAADAGDYPAAIALLNDLLRNADPTLADRSRLAHTLAAAQLARRTGGPELTRAVVQTLRTIADDEELAVVERAQVHNKIGQIIMQSDYPDEFRSELEAAIPFLESEPLEQARSMSVLGWPRVDTCPAETHLSWLERAGRVPLGALPRSDQLRVAINCATALLMLGREAGWELADGLVAAGSAAPPADEGRLAAIWFLNSASQAMLRGRHAEAERRLGLAADLARSHDDPRTLSHVLGTQCHLDWLRGAWSGLAGRAAALRDSPDAESAPVLEARLVTALLDRATRPGAVDERSPDLRDVLEDVRARGVLDLLMEPSAALAQGALTAGRSADALAVTDLPVRVIQAKGGWVWGCGIVPARVEALLAEGRREEARSLADAFAAGVEAAHAPAPATAAVVCQALVEQAAGSPARSAALLGDAAEQWVDLPRPYDAALARERQGEALLAARRERAAIESLTVAHTRLRELAADRDADRVGRRLRTLGVPVRRHARRGRRGYGDRLSPSELDVVRLVVAGWTTPRIAEALFRSPRTVSGQLQSAMRKLGVTSRTALALAAVESGLVPEPPVGAGPAEAVPE